MEDRFEINKPLEKTVEELSKYFFVFRNFKEIFKDRENFYTFRFIFSDKKHNTIGLNLLKSVDKEYQNCLVLILNYNTGDFIRFIIKNETVTEIIYKVDNETNNKIKKWKEENEQRN